MTPASIDALRRVGEVIAARPLRWWTPPSWPPDPDADTVAPGSELDDPLDGTSNRGLPTLHVPGPRFGPYRSAEANRRWHRLRIIAVATQHDPWARAVTQNPYAWRRRREHVSEVERRHGPSHRTDGDAYVATALLHVFAVLTFQRAVRDRFPGLCDDLSRWRRRQRRLALRQAIIESPSNALSVVNELAMIACCVESQLKRQVVPPGSRNHLDLPSTFNSPTAPVAPTVAVADDGNHWPWVLRRLQRIAHAVAHSTLRSTDLQRPCRLAWRVLARYQWVADDWPFGAFLSVSDMFGPSVDGPSLQPTRRTAPRRGTQAGSSSAGASSDQHGGPGEQSNGDGASAGTAMSRASGTAVGKARHGEFGGHGTAARCFPVPEWDYRQGCMLDRHCLVHEHALTGTDHEALQRLCRRRPGLLAAVRRAFLQTPASGRQISAAQSDGDWIDLDATVHEMVEARAGRAGDGRVYLRRVPARRDLALAMLLDMSASTDCPVPGSESVTQTSADDVNDDDDFPLAWGTFDDSAAHATPPRRVIDVAKDALILCGAALHELGDPFAIYGFSGMGRERVDFYIAKAFGERARTRHWAAVEGMRPRQYTRMGAAIRHACRRLLREPAARRALLIVSDGYPQDSDYGPDRRDERYGVEDTAHALAEAARQGIRSMCITVDPAGHDYLSRMLSADAYRVIGDIEDLPVALAEASARLRAAN